jgi:DNA polymerase-1
LIQQATTEDAYRLLHDGTLVLADIEANGLLIDRDLLKHNIERTAKMAANAEDKLKATDIWAEWRKRFGSKASLTSREQLGKILMGRYPKAWKDEDKTATGKPKVDEETLQRIEVPFIQEYLKLQRIIKIRSTYLIGILRETDINGYLHPMFGLGNAVTYRSQSDSPNFQNMPIRIPWVAELIRSCIVAPEDYYLLELDFKGLEVCISACYNEDPKLVAYVSNPALDMHRDMAAEIFKCATEQVHKDARYNAKNKFVFPQFYGDWYLSCAKNLWDSVRKMNVCLVDGTPMYEHLKTQGISRLGKCDPEQSPVPGTFEHHIKKVEHAFWYDRFKVYQAWKDSWYADYQRKGYIRMKTGFTVSGGKKSVLNRKECINYPVQGSAFHCLLWCLIQLHRWLQRKGMRSRIVGQIHDSIISYVHKDEFEKFLTVANRILTVQLPETWEWIIVPLAVEAEASPLGGSWFEKKPVKS